MEDGKVSRGPLINWLFKPCDLLLSIMRSMARRLNSVFIVLPPLVQRHGDWRVEERLILQRFVTSQGECRAVGLFIWTLVWLASIHPFIQLSIYSSLHPLINPWLNYTSNQLSIHPTIYHPLTPPFKYLSLNFHTIHPSNQLSFHSTLHLLINTWFNFTSIRPLIHPSTKLSIHPTIYNPLIPPFKYLPII